MKRINLVFQELLKIFLIFLLMFVWVRYLLSSFVASLLISLASAVGLYLILHFISANSKNRIELKLKEKEHAENIFLSLAADKRRTDFFYKLASKKHSNIKKFSNYLIITHESGTKTLLYCNFTFQELGVAQFMEIYGKVSGKAGRVVVLCHSYDKKLNKFASNFDADFLFLDRYDAYKRLYKFYDCYPEISVSYKPDKALGFKDFISFSFNKKRVKGYLLSALLLIISGLFIKATLYYCIVASLLVVFAIISQFNNVYNPKEEEVF